MRERRENPLKLTEVKAVFVIKILFALALFFIIGYTKGQTAAFSALLGSGIGFFPSLLFATLFFKITGSLVIKKVASRFYLGEIFKFLLTALFFVVAFQWPGVAYGPLFIGFIVTQGAYGLVLLKRKPLSKAMPILSL